MKKRKIPQVEPWYGQKERQAVDDYLKIGAWLTEFQKTIEFEESIARQAGVKYASVVNNGTVALFLAFKALGVGPGDEVIVPDMTMIATPNAVILAGATPIFCDIDKDAFCIDPDEVKKYFSNKTKAICHVSLGGRAGRLEELVSFCRKEGVALVEDAAQAFGSYHAGKALGSFGDVGVYSFTPHKIITTGQGGAVVTNKKEIYDSVEKLKDFGRMKGGGDNHDFMGWNFKFTDMQAVFGLAQMENIKERIEKKRKIFNLYAEAFGDLKEVKMIKTDTSQTTPWFIEILVDEPKKLAEFLKRKEIDTRPNYPAIHTQPIYSSIAGDFPVSKFLGERGLWLPSSLTLEKDDVETVCEEVREFFKS